MPLSGQQLCCWKLYFRKALLETREERYWWLGMGQRLMCSLGLSINQPVVPFSHTKSAPATTSQPISSTILS